MRYFSVLLAVFFLIVSSIGDALARPGKGKPAEIIAAIVKEKSFTDEVEALGTLKSKENIEVTASVTELVTEVNFSDGARVNEGDILIKMDAAEEIAALEEEQSIYREAIRQLNRVRSLAKRGAASKSNLDERERLANTASARIAAIKSRIDERVIRAPFSGVVGLRNMSVGALVQPGTVITTLDNDSEMKLDFSVPAVLLDSLKPGVGVAAQTKAFPNETFSGTISSVNSRVDPVTRSITARAIIDNSDLKLKPGLLMRVVLQNNPRNALVIPEEAIITNAEEHNVLVLEQNGEGDNENFNIANRKITIGSRKRGEVEIISGLNPGEKVVAHGITKTGPGRQAIIIGFVEDGKSIAEIIAKQNQAR